MDKKITSLFLFFFIFISAYSQTDSVDACREYEKVLQQADTLFAQMRAYDSAMIEINRKILRGGISESVEDRLYRQIDDLKKEKEILQKKMEEYAVKAKTLRMECENSK